MTSFNKLFRLLNFLMLLFSTASMFFFQFATAAPKEMVERLSTGEDPEEFVQSKITSHSVFVFSRSYGESNERVKGLLLLLGKNTNTQVEFLDVDLLPGFDGSLIMVEIGELTGKYSLPSIFIGGKHVGGHTDMEEKHAIGELEDMIREAGQEL